MKKVIIIGAGGHARVIADIIKLNGDIVYGFLDDKGQENIHELKILGGIDDINRFLEKDCYFIVAIGNNQIRYEIMTKYSNAIWYTAIHPAAVIANDVEIGSGTAIMANAVINTGSKIGRGVIINTSATVDHDCLIGDFVHISPGAHLAGNVRLGEKTWIGIGANVINNIDICSECIIGAGAVVVKNIIKKGTYVGVPAKKFLIN